MRLMAVVLAAPGLSGLLPALGRCRWPGRCRFGSSNVVIPAAAALPLRQRLAIVGAYGLGTTAARCCDTVCVRCRCLSRAQGHARVRADEEGCR